MKTEVRILKVPYDGKKHFHEERLLNAGFPFDLCVSDGDEGHSHDAEFHTFPCTLEQLVALRDSIDRVLKTQEAL